jgi:hypothetical protein
MVILFHDHGEEEAEEKGTEKGSFNFNQWSRRHSTISALVSQNDPSKRWPLLDRPYWRSLPLDMRQSYRLPALGYRLQLFKSLAAVLVQGGRLISSCPLTHLMQPSVQTRTLWFTLYSPLVLVAL